MNDLFQETFSAITVSNKSDPTNSESRLQVNNLEQEKADSPVQKKNSAL